MAELNTALDALPYLSMAELASLEAAVTQQLSSKVVVDALVARHREMRDELSRSGADALGKDAGTMVQKCVEAGTVVIDIDNRRLLQGIASYWAAIANPGHQQETVLRDYEESARGSNPLAIAG